MGRVDWTNGARPSRHGAILGDALALLAAAGHKDAPMEIPECCLTCAFRPGTLPNATAETGTGFMNALRKYRVATDAGDHGAITIWRDDKGGFQCAFTRFHATIDHKGFPTKVSVKKWLVDWFPKMREPHP